MTLLRRLLHLLMGCVILAMLAVGALAWRLSKGPLDVTPLTALYEQHSTPHITVGHAALVWEGFGAGVDRPLEVRVDDMRALGKDGSLVAQIPHATVSVSLTALLLGRIVWRAVELDRTTLRLVRAADGSTELDPGDAAAPPASDPQTGPGSAPAPTPAPRGDEAEGDNPFAGLLAALRRPPGQESRSRFGELQRLVIRGGTMTVIDNQLGLRWEATDVAVDLRRLARGGVEGSASVTLTAGMQTARLTLDAALGAADGAAHGATTVHVALTPISPARLSGLAGPASTMLAALDAPVGLAVDATLDTRLAPLRAALSVSVGAGAIDHDGARIPITGGNAALNATPATLAITEATLHFGRAGSGPAPTITLHGRAERHDTAWKAALSLDLDHLALGDLPAYWPPGTGGGARPWLVENLTAGLAHDAHVEASAEGDTGGASGKATARLTGLAGGFDADAVTVHWLRPVPPAEAAHARLTLLGPDALLITASAGTAGTGHQGKLVIPQASMKITGLTQKDQTGVIALDVTGGVPDTLALLAQPRLNLLSKRPLSFTDPAGTLAGHVDVDIPLDNDVTIDRIAIRAHAKLSALHLGNVAAGRALDQGTATLDVTNDGLAASGQALLAHAPAKLTLTEDFRDGPPGQVIETADVSAVVTPAAFLANDMPADLFEAGTAQVTLGFREQRNGQARLAMAADLGAARIGTPLGWSKGGGTTGHASGTLLLSHGTLVGLEDVSADAPGLLIRSHVDIRNGRPKTLRLDRVEIGRTRAAGSIELPVTEGGAWGADLSGPMLDASALLAARDDTAHPPPPAQGHGPHGGQRGAPYTVSLKFASVLLAGGVSFRDASLQAVNDGLRMTRASVHAGGEASLDGAIEPTPGGRRVSLRTSNAGALLRGLDVLGDVQGGALTLDGRYDDRDAASPLSGTALAERFRVTNAPVMGRILQGMTLYGLVDALRGPGLHFERLVMPFRYENHVLTLAEARAFSPSLGLTAKGTIDFAARRLALSGTIVPAYFFNTLLGHVPLLGRLFSPETGGGLFAATYRLTGPPADPQVAVNPLAALTPGALRGLFGLLP